MKKLQACLVGCGNRGLIYADYSLMEKDELEIIAAVDPNKVHLNEAKNKYNLKDEMIFNNLDDFLNKNIKCDFIINATMDQVHYETGKKILEHGYNMLLEKPITPNENELLELEKIANEKNLKVVVCHVLRYTPFYRSIKRAILNGEIGKIMTMEMNEHVWIAHFMDSFVRGHWRSEKECGSSFLLQKSCHDMDLICWINNESTPYKISSFGSRSQFILKNAPEGATEYCYNCPHNDTCLYSAQKIHLEQDLLPFQTWLEMHKPIDEITKEEKAEFLKHNVYGKCAYNTGGDINDRQIINIEFKNGSVAQFTMVGGTSKAGRNIHIVGTKGEIEGKLEDGKFILRKFDRSGNRFWYDEIIVDVSEELKKEYNDAGHDGGDYGIMHDTIRYLNGDNSSISISSLSDSVNSHLVVYAAEKSRKIDSTVRLEDR